jgi:hypothetical protein
MIIKLHQEFSKILFKKRWKVSLGKLIGLIIFSFLLYFMFVLPLI